MSTTLICIDPKSGVLTRYVGRRATHQPCSFNVPVNGEEMFLKGLDWLRTKPDEMGATKSDDQST